MFEGLHYSASSEEKSCILNAIESSGEIYFQYDICKHSAILLNKGDRTKILFKMQKANSSKDDD